LLYLINILLPAYPAPVLIFSISYS